MPPGTNERPRIGLTLDAEPPGGYSRLPWYAIRENYCAAIARAGGLPIALPHQTELVTAYLDLLDGLVVTGGAFDLDPGLYGARERHATVRTKEQRTAFEWAITHYRWQPERTAQTQRKRRAKARQTGAAQLGAGCSHVRPFARLPAALERRIVVA
jgi:gamma-glutamyl-gamma-aminobutyrate hydrolase PuuD